MTTTADDPGETTGPAPIDAADATARRTLVVAVLGFFVVTLDAVVVNVALPSIREDTGSGIAGLQWVVDGYTLAFAALLLWGGALSDRIGARRAFAAGMAMFAVASAACGAAPDLVSLVAARVVQGGAAAVMMPASMSLIRAAYPDPDRRAWAIGIWAMGGAAASTSGPLLGGLLTLVSWRWIFFVNLPVGIVALALVLRAERSPRQHQTFDWRGQLAAVVAMAALTFGTIEAGSHGFGAPLVLGALAVAVLAVVAFVVTERRVADPVVPLGLFAVRNVRIANAVGFAFVFCYYGLPFVMSLHLQEDRGLSSFATGVTFLPMMVVGAMLTPFSARVTARFGPRAVIGAGMGSMVTGFVVLAALPAGAPVAAIAAGMLLVGLGGPFTAPPIAAVLLGSVPGDLAGTASGVFNTSRQLGGALAVAAFGGLLSLGSGDLTGLRVSLVVSAGVALAAGLSAARIDTAMARDDPAVAEGAPGEQ
ncbi:MAG: MFS transporter [Actinomycetota bacterium]|nr:MFS transporter [Actinomycetota bacterium]